MLENRSLCLMWEVGEDQRIPKWIFMANLRNFLPLESFAFGFLLQIHHQRKTLMKTLRPTAAVWGRNVSWPSRHPPPLLYLGLPQRYGESSGHLFCSRTFLGEIQVLCGKSGHFHHVRDFSFMSFATEYIVVRGDLLSFSEVKNKPAFPYING